MEQEGDEKLHKLDNLTIGSMLAVAAAIDATEMLLDWMVVGLVINPFIELFTWLTFWFWLKTKGVSFGDAKKGIALIAGLLGEAVTDGEIPLWTADIGLIIFFDRAEEVAQKAMGVKDKIDDLGVKAGKGKIISNRFRNNNQNNTEKQKPNRFRQQDTEQNVVDDEVDNSEYQEVA